MITLTQGMILIVAGIAGMSCSCIALIILNIVIRRKKKHVLEMIKHE